MKKKKHNKLDGDEYQSQENYSPADDGQFSLNDHIPVAPIINDTLNTNNVGTHDYRWHIYLFSNLLFSLC